MTQSKTKVRKAVIPAAGFGTWMFPATKAVKKELFPIISRDGRVKPIIQIIVEEAISAGIEEIVRPELVNRTETPFMWRGGSSLFGISTPYPVAAASATGST